MCLGIFESLSPATLPAQFPPPASCSTRPATHPSPHTNCATAHTTGRREQGLAADFPVPLVVGLACALIRLFVDDSFRS